MWRVLRLRSSVCSVQWIDILSALLTKSGAGGIGLKLKAADGVELKWLGKGAAAA